jgi:hypothetical protein
MQRINWGEFQGIRRVFGQYWSAYGGVKQLFRSAYFHIAIVMTAVLYPRWLGDQWPSDVLTVIPSILGFSLGGYAMLLAFGDREFLRLLAEPIHGRSTSYFMELNASFVHFILLQTISIFLALVGLSYVAPGAQGALVVFSCFSYLVFLYALAAAVAATMAVFRVVTLYEEAVSITTPSSKEDHD